MAQTCLLACCTVANNPDPTLELSTTQGSTRTLDDWATMFHLCLVILPDRPEGTRFLEPVRRIFAQFGDADCRTAIVVPSTAPIAARILGEKESESLVFVDPDKALVKSLGLERLPALVHLRQDTTLVDVAEGWDPVQWQRVADGIAKSMGWTAPDVRTVRYPPATAGWAVA